MTESETAAVFDIKRFAVHDGDGIRTTVFFKGCGLRCLWCQNPEGLEPGRSALYLKCRCIHCGSCRKAAASDEVSWDNDHPVINRSFCGSFDHIISACPAGAIAYDCVYYTAQELLEEIRKDKVFFREDGGVTFSGGEPFLHGTFLLEMLKRCREEQIRTAVETALYAPKQSIIAALPCLDQIYADIKVMDEERHRRLTGQSNKTILENAKFLLESQTGDRVIIRTPLIPGATADPANIRAIAAFICGIRPDVKYELLNYNELAPSKYEMTGKTYGLSETLRRFSEEEMKTFCKAAKEGGVKYLVNDIEKEKRNYGIPA